MSDDTKPKVLAPDPRWILVQDRTLANLDRVTRRLEKESETMSRNLQGLLKDMTQEMYYVYKKGWQDGFAVGAQLAPRDGS